MSLCGSTKHVNTLNCVHDCLQMAGLKACLKRQAVSPGCGVSRAFLKAQALLFGGYKDALQGSGVQLSFLFINLKKDSK